MRDKELTTIFLTGRVSRTMVIPIEMARDAGLEDGTYVTVERLNDGIFIKKLHVPEKE